MGGGGGGNAPVAPAAAQSPYTRGAPVSRTGGQTGAINVRGVPAGAQQKYQFQNPNAVGTATGIPLKGWAGQPINAYHAGTGQYNIATPGVQGYKPTQFTPVVKQPVLMPQPVQQPVVQQSSGPTFVGPIGGAVGGGGKDGNGIVAPFLGKDKYDVEGDDNFLTQNEIKKKEEIIGGTEQPNYNSATDIRTNQNPNLEQRLAAEDLNHNVQQIYGTETGNNITSLVTGSPTGQTITDKIATSSPLATAIDKKINPSYYDNNRADSSANPVTALERQIGRETSDYAKSGKVFDANDPSTWKTSAPLAGQGSTSSGGSAVQEQATPTENTTLSPAPAPTVFKNEYSGGFESRKSHATDNDDGPKADQTRVVDPVTGQSLSAYQLDNRIRSNPDKYAGVGSASEQINKAAETKKVAAQKVEAARPVADVSISRTRKDVERDPTEVRYQLKTGSKFVSIDGKPHLVNKQGTARPVHPNVAKEAGFSDSTPTTTPKASAPLADSKPAPRVSAPLASSKSNAPTPGQAPAPAPATPSDKGPKTTGRPAAPTPKPAVKAIDKAAQSAGYNTAVGKILAEKYGWSKEKIAARGYNDGGLIGGNTMNGPLGYNAGGRIARSNIKEEELIAQNQSLANQTQSGGQQGGGVLGGIGKKLLSAGLTSALGPVGGALAGPLGGLFGFNVGGAIPHPNAMAKGPLNPNGYNEGGNIGATPIKKEMDLAKLDTQMKMDEQKMMQAELAFKAGEQRKDIQMKQAMQQKEESHKAAMKLKKDSATMSKGPLSGDK